LPTEWIESATLRQYNDSATSLADFITASGRSPDLQEFKERDLREYLTYLQDCGLSGGGVHAIGRALRAMWNWAVRDELLPSTPFSRVKLPRYQKPVMPVLQPEQFSELLSVTRAHPRYTLRNIALLTVMFDTGVRVGELVGLKLDDVDWEQGRLTVLGKGNKLRTVPVGSQALRCLHRYIHRERTPAFPQEQNVFLNRLREPLMVSGVQQELEFLGAKAGLERAECSPHTFRRGFAVQYLRNGGDVFQLQQILGHESLEMTRRYVRYLDKDLKLAHARNSPVDRMRRSMLAGQDARLVIIQEPAFGERSPTAHREAETAKAHRG